jgi:hypothetical protein
MLSTVWNAIGRDTISIKPWGSLCLFSISRVNHLPNKEEYARIKADLERYERHLLTNSTWNRNKYQNNPEFRSSELLRDKLQKERLRKTSEAYSRQQLVHSWARRYTWFREQLPWKSHHPILFAQKLKHVCASCRVSRSDGSKLWWKKLADSESYTCNGCYTKADWNEVMPEGYADCRTKVEIVARMKYLGESPP